MELNSLVGLDDKTLYSSEKEFVSVFQTLNLKLKKAAKFCTFEETHFDVTGVYFTKRDNFL